MFDGASNGAYFLYYERPADLKSKPVNKIVRFSLIIIIVLNFLDNAYASMQINIVNTFY